MQKPSLLAFVDDLHFRSEIERIAQAKEIDFYFAAPGEQLSQLVKTLNPFLILVDLSGQDSEWLFRHMSAIGYARPKLPIVGFVTALQKEVRERAEKYGCRLILEKSELIEKLPDVIENVYRQVL